MAVPEKNLIELPENVTYEQAAMLEPHTAAELSIDDIISMCDELYEAHTNAGYPIL